MIEEYPYELLFKFAFPDWKGPIPPLPKQDQGFQQRSFLSSDSEQTDGFIDESINDQEKQIEEDYEIEGFVIWEVQSESLSNLINERPKSCTATSITKVIIHTQDGKSISLGETINIHFSENCVHFLPNSSWVFSIDPEFQSSIAFFDPIIALWLQNTECLEKSENLVPISYFDKVSNPMSNDLNEVISQLFEIFVTLHETISSQPQLLEWINDIEIPHLKLMGRMHRTSLYIDISKVESERARLTKILSNIEKEIYSIAGCEFNILSPFDVSDIMFNHLHVIPPDSTPQNTFSIDSRHRVTVHREFASTNSLILEKISHPIARKIIDYRKIQKLISNWLSFTDFCDEDGGLHPTFLVCSTATGRISTKSPNLQNIPCQDKRGNSPMNNPSDPLTNTNIRSFFIPCPQQEPIISLPETNSIENGLNFEEKCQNSEYVLLSLDYSQLELRILAHFSQDASLCDLCSQPGIDLHSHIAKIIYNVDSIDKITAKQREEIKQAVYATIYGKGWTKDGVEKGQKLEAVLKTFPGIRTFVTNATAQATKDEYIDTLCGKKRLLPNIKSSNAIERKRDQRMAINTKIQGSAADFVKFALLQIMKECGNLVEPLLQLHDEWLFRTKIKPGTKEFDDLCRILKKSAECADKIGLDVPIPCKITYGPSYGELKPI